MNLNHLLDKAKWCKRAFFRRWYGLKNVDRLFLATNGLSKVSKDIYAGSYSYIGPDCEIYPNVTIGDFTMLAGQVSIIGGDHNFRIPAIPTVFNGRDIIPPTTIGKDVWIGSRSIIMCGVKIGNGAIVAAGSVVTKDVRPYEIVGGVPAKLIRMRFTPEEIEKHEKMLNSSKDIIIKNHLKLVGTHDLHHGNQIN